MPTMSEFYGKVGFASPAADSKFVKRRHAAVELIATVALAVSLIIAVTAVSIGAARAQVIGAVGQGREASLAIAAFVALVAVGGIGGLSVMAACHRAPGRDRC
jgi:hypothetical protein